MATVIVYTKNSCIACSMTKKYLKKKDLEYIEYFIDKDMVKLEELKSKGYLSVPVVEIYEDDKMIKSWAGFVPDELNKL